MTATTTRYPLGALAGALANDGAGTYLAYGVIVAHEPPTGDRHTGRVTVRRPDGTEHTVSDHGDFITVHALNATCDKCGADVWRNPWRGAHEGIPDVDATGSARCPAADTVTGAPGFHGRA